MDENTGQGNLSNAVSIDVLENTDAKNDERIVKLNASEKTRIISYEIRKNSDYLFESLKSLEFSVNQAIMRIEYLRNELSLVLGLLRKNESPEFIQWIDRMSRDYASEFQGTPSTFF